MLAQTFLSSSPDEALNWLVLRLQAICGFSTWELSAVGDCFELLFKFAGTSFKSYKPAIPTTSPIVWVQT